MNQPRTCYPVYGAYKINDWDDTGGLGSRKHEMNVFNWLRPHTVRAMFDPHTVRSTGAQQAYLVITVYILLLTSYKQLVVAIFVAFIGCSSHVSTSESNQYHLV